MNQLVIARYAEDLAWLAEVPPGFEIHIYNKGAPIRSDAVIARAASIAERPNEGRESETYLTHVADLTGADRGTEDDFVVFAQGDPFEHSPDFLALLHGWQKWDDVQPLSWRWRVTRDIPPAGVLARETGGFIDGLRVRPELFSLQSWTPLGFHDVGTFWLQDTYRKVHNLEDGSNIAAHFLAMCGLPDLARQAEAHLLGRFSYGAVFAARRSRLAQVPEGALANLRQASLSHEVYGYVLERMWLHLFGAAFILPAPVAESAPMVPPTESFVPPDCTPPRQRRLKKLAHRLKDLLPTP
jgi:hypothetical protein